VITPLGCVTTVGAATPDHTMEEHMAYEFFVTVEGARQGHFKNETPREKHQGKIPGISFHYSVKSPRDSASGMASGRRTHQPVSFVKAWGASTPQFFQALCTNEVLKSVLFEFVRTDHDGEEYVYHSVQLINAAVTEVDHYLPEDTQGTSPDRPELERISLTFQSIEIENKDGKTMATDDWLQTR
jgi:type VI secretion system secreted protein Hcp